MKKLHKILPIFLVMAVLITFASCKKQPTVEIVETAPPSTTSESTTALVSESETESSTESTTEETQTQKPKPTKPEPTTQKTAPKPTQKPTESTTARSIKPQGADLWGTWRTTETIDASDLVEDNYPEIKNSLKGIKIKLLITASYLENGTYAEGSKIQNPQEVQTGFENAILKASGVTADDPNYSEAVAEAKSEAKRVYADLESELSDPFNCTYKADSRTVTYYYGFDPFASGTYTVSGNALILTLGGVTTKYTRA